MAPTVSVTLPRLFIRSFLLSATTIGGGFVILSVMEKIYVRRLGWLSREEMTDITSLAQSAPGAVAVNAALLAGFRLHGITGAAVSLLGCILPPFGIMCVLGALYSYIRDSAVVGSLLPYVRLGLGVFLAKIAYGLCRQNLTDILPWVVYAASLGGMVFLGLSGIWFLLGAGVLAVIFYQGGKR